MHFKTLYRCHKEAGTIKEETDKSERKIKQNDIKRQKEKVRVQQVSCSHTFSLSKDM